MKAQKEPSHEGPWRGGVLSGRLALGGGEFSLGLGLPGREGSFGAFLGQGGFFPCHPVVISTKHAQLVKRYLRFVNGVSCVDSWCNTHQIRQDPC